MGCRPARLLYPWNFPGRNAEVGCYFLLQGSSWPRDHTHISCISYVGRWILYQCTTWEVLQIYVYESPLDSKEVKPINPKVNQPWIFIGKTGAEAPILWPPYLKSWLIGKDSDAGKDWRQEEKGTTEDEMPGWHHWLDGHESGWTPGDDDGQGNLVCCDSWGCKELDMTEVTYCQMYDLERSQRRYLCYKTKGLWWSLIRK